jgi:PQQ-like domain
MMRAQRIRAVAWGALATASLLLAACGGGSPASSASAGNGGAGSSTSGSSSSGATASHSPAAATDLSWPQADGGPARTGDQPGETVIGTGNVSGLSEVRSYPTRSDPSAPLIVNGILYVDAGLLYAFDATGATGCPAAPGTCTPLWTAPTAYFHGMAVADGKVFVSDGEGVQAFDAAGSENCSGTPKVCSPLWATSTKTVTGPPFVPGGGSPVVVGDVLYVPGYGDGMALSQGGALVAAFDAAGQRGCSGTPAVCVPMWTTSGLPASSGNAGSPAVANGVLYIANSTLYAFDANGSQACTGTPKVCGPLWTAAMTGSGATDGAPAVAGGVVYVGTFYTGLYAFDAAGSRDCSAAAAGKACAPLWHAPESSTGSIDVAAAVAGGVVYVASATGTLTAFAAQAPGSCPGTGDVRTCTVAPLWTGTGGVATSSSPVVAGGVVYVAAGGTYAFDAAGSRDCTTAAAGKACTPLWKSAGTFAMEGALAVVDGVLYVNVTGGNTTYAYKL